MISRRDVISTIVPATGLAALTPSLVDSAALQDRSSPGASTPALSSVFRGAGAKAVPRSPIDKLGDSIDLRDFMTAAMRQDVAAGRLSVDCSPALQAAIDAISGRGLSSLQAGGHLHIGAGRYLVSHPLRYAWRNAEQVNDDGDMRRLTLTGDGQANTVLFYSGDSSAPALTVEGHATREAQGAHLRFVMEGMRVTRYGAGRRSGSGLRLRGAALITLSDVEFSEFDINLDAGDVLRLFAANCHFLGGNIGFQARHFVYSQPNLFKLLHCSFSGNYQVGALIAKGANISFDSCAFEANGRAEAPASAALVLRDGPNEGGASCHLDNCYFENNAAGADVLVDWRDYDGGTVKLTACSFQRGGRLRVTQHHVDLRSVNSNLMVHLDCCAFKSFGDYVPDSSRSAVVWQGQVRAVETACYFQNEVEQGEFATRRNKR